MKAIFSNLAKSQMRGTIEVHLMNKSNNMFDLLPREIITRTDICTKLTRVKIATSKADICFV